MWKRYSMHFQPGEASSRGLLHDCENRWIICSSTDELTDPGQGSSQQVTEFVTAPPPPPPPLRLATANNHHCSRAGASKDRKSRSHETWLNQHLYLQTLHSNEEGLGLLSKLLKHEPKETRAKPGIKGAEFSSRTRKKLCEGGVLVNISHFKFPQFPGAGPRHAADTHITLRGPGKYHHNVHLDVRG